MSEPFENGLALEWFLEFLNFWYFLSLSEPISATCLHAAMFCFWFSWSHPWIFLVIDVLENNCPEFYANVFTLRCGGLLLL